MVVQTICGRSGKIVSRISMLIFYTIVHIEIKSIQIRFQFHLVTVGLDAIEVNRVRAREEGMGCTRRETRSPVRCKVTGRGCIIVL